MATDFVVLPTELPLDAALRRMAEANCRFAVLADGRRIAGFVGPASDVLRDYLTGPQRPVGAVARRDFLVARADDLVEGVVERLRHRGRSVALVVGGRGIPRAGDVVGVVSKTAIAEAVIRTHSA
jgi:CIC family chloride channel protein